MKIKLIESGFQTYTGTLGEIEFVDGQSVNDLSAIQINRIAGAIRVENLDGESVGAASDIVSKYNDEAEVVTALPTQESLDFQAEAAALLETPEAPVLSDAELMSELTATEETETAEAPPAVLAQSKHTSESLGLVADSGGIAAIREIAETFGVKGNAVAKIIEDILAAQSVA